MDTPEIDAFLLAYDKLEGLPGTSRLYFDPTEREPNFDNDDIRLVFKIGYQTAVDSSGIICDARLLGDLKPCVVAVGIKHARHMDSNGVVWPA